MSKRPKWKFLLVQSLTIGRIPLIMVFLGVTLFAAKPPGEYWFSVAFGAMILSAITDLFDGLLARRFDVVTRLGALADPLCDKVFYVTTFPTLVYLAALKGQYAHAQMLLGLTILFLMRDQWVSFLRAIGASYNVDARANWSGKARTLISFPAVCTIYYYLQAPTEWWLQVHIYVIYFLEAISMLINTVSICVYSARYWPYLKKECMPRDEDEGRQC